MANENNKTPPPIPGLSFTAQDIKDIVASLKDGIVSSITEALPLAIAASQQVMSMAQMKERSERALAGTRRRETCPECQQDIINGKYACGGGGDKGKHRKVIALPPSKRHWKYFRGVYLNGKLYLSRGPWDYVTIPEDFGIEKLLTDFEENEDELLQGRMASHNSGEWGGLAKSPFVPATIGWR